MSEDKNDLQIHDFMKTETFDYAPKITVVVPALNEEKGVGFLLDETKEAMKPFSYDLVVVDGHSIDGTRKIAEDRGAIVILQNSRGYGDALLSGFSFARRKLRADMLVMIDADESYDPKDIPRLLQPLVEGGADLVIGNRFSCMRRKSMSLRNKIGNKVLSWIARRILRISVSDTQCGLRAFRADLLDLLDLKTRGMPFAMEMLAEAKNAGARILEVPVSYRLRIGETKLNRFRDGFRILGVTLRLARDYEPLLFFGSLGFLLAAMGGAVGTNVVVAWATTGIIEHLASVSLAALFIIAGIQVFTIGLIAEMIRDTRKYIKVSRNGKQSTSDNRS